VINWLDFWYELEQCGRDDWPQLIRVPALLVDRRRDDAATDSCVYTREDVAARLRQAADFPVQGRDRNVPLVVLEPVEDGVYRIAEELSDELVQPEPGDDTSGAPDDNRQIVFLDFRLLFHAG
jgi:hypothetical protein